MRARVGTMETGGERVTYVLTAREYEVAALMAEGLSDREISARLYISLETARGHAKSVRSKLNLHNRARIAAWWYGPIATPGEYSRRLQAQAAEAC